MSYTEKQLREAYQAYLDEHQVEWGYGHNEQSFEEWVEEEQKYGYPSMTAWEW